jgi:hypothetical protein
MIYVVTGLMRSGTSVLSQMLHEIGVPMGLSMRFPLQVKGAHLEWEDHEFSEPLAQLLLGDTDAVGSWGLEHFMYSYIVNRNAVHAGDWGVKCPFLLPYIEKFRKVADSVDSRVKVILTEREPVETYESLARLVDVTKTLEMVQKIQSQLEPAWNSFRGREDLRVRLVDTQSDPEAVRAGLAKFVKE